MMTETSVEMIGVTIIEMMTEIMAEVGMIGTETIVIVIGEGIVGMIVIHIETVTGMGIGTGLLVHLLMVQVQVFLVLAVPVEGFAELLGVES
jgi:hypothetical protein